MLHVTAHFALGLAVGAALATPALARAWRADRPAGPAATRWLMASYAMGLLAITPNLLLHMGVPPSAIAAPWMNVFLLHPLLDRMKHGGMVPGQIALAALFAAHYGLLLAAIRRHDRRIAARRATPAPAQPR